MGVYVHIPFCEHKCYYCDFHSIVVGDQVKFNQVASNYLRSVQQEAELYHERLGDLKFESLFFGGGTPSLVDPKLLGELSEFLLKELPFTSQVEVTIEANPHSLTKAGVASLKKAGVNRVSLGVQAFQDRILQSLGRVHKAKDIWTSVEILRDQGINNLSLDLMYGLPGQSLANWQHSLEQAVSLKPEHLSCYSLIVEPETPLHAWASQGLVKVSTDDLQGEMYDLARKLLQEAGYEHYEISNFARPGFKARHNLLYWHNQPFLALGSGSTGYLGRRRYTNVANVEQYLQLVSRGQLPVASCEQVSLEQELEETMMVGMRLLAGVAEQSFIERYGRSYFVEFSAEIASLIDRGLVEFEAGYLHVTERGLALENQVSGAFLR